MFIVYVLDQPSMHVGSCKTNSVTDYQAMDVSGDLSAPAVTVGETEVAMDSAPVLDFLFFCL